MALSLDYYLKSLASSYYLKNDSTENTRITASVSNLVKNLKEDMNPLINRIFIFGSYDRDTILPRSIDENSDIDVMVVFNHTEHERTPETYRIWLKLFADKYYKNRYGSEVVKSFPTVTVKLNNIIYDLVPAKEEHFFYRASVISIPSKVSGWQETDPNDIKSKLTIANTQYNGIVRPIIRLLKAWNASNGYPFDSYDLELQITNMNFFNDTVQTGFFWAVRMLSYSWGDSQNKQNKIASLQFNVQKAIDALEANNLDLAKNWLHRVLPKP
ncbi:MAG: nucleotidyltransferase [Chitinophagaceae bacterium]|nr:MAG: nucleotidyltransferase [Chitinophagaceae bacterium]